MKTKQKSIKKNYIYNMMYQILLIIIPLVVTPHVARVLLPEGVGQYSFSSALITYFTTFASLGFVYYAQREIAKFQDNKHSQSITFWEINICRLIPTFICLVLNLLLVVTHAYGNYSILMLILSINIIAIALDVSFFFHGNEEFGKMVIINMIIKILGTTCIFIFVRKQDDVWLYTLIHSAIVITSSLAMWIFLPKHLERVSIHELKPFKHLPGTLRLFLPSLATTVYTLLDKSLIGVITHNDAQIGFYEQADKIVKTALTLILALGQVMIPRNTYEISKGNYQKVKENNLKAIHFVWLIGFPMAFGLIAISQSFVPWFFGETFAYSAILIDVMAVLILIIGLSNVIGLQYMIPNKMDKKFTIAILCGALINLIINIPLIILWQSLGAAIATIVAELTVTIIMLCMSNNNVGFKEMLRSSIKPFVSAVLMFFVIFFIQHIFSLSSTILNTMILLCAGIFVYSLSILLLKDSLALNLLKQIKSKIFKRKQKVEQNINNE